MKRYVLTIIGALLFGNSIAVAQDYDDVYYDTGSTKKKTETTVRYHLITVRMTMIQKTKNNKCW